MDLIEFNTHSFIIKIWLEEPAQGSRKGKWRGHITHVPSGKRRYLKSLAEILAFIVPYLASMGVRLTAYWRLRSWLGKGAAEHRSAPEIERSADIGGQPAALRPESHGGRPAKP